MNKVAVLTVFFLLLVNAGVHATGLESIREQISSDAPMSKEIEREENEKIIRVDKESLAPFWIDDCEVRYNHVGNEDALRGKLLRRCSDDTVSFHQPRSEGFFGYEGKCGQTAASNIIFSYCRHAVAPDSYVDKYLSDATPGVRPGTLEEGLQDVFQLIGGDCPQINWRSQKAEDEDDFLKLVKRALIPKMSLPNQVSRVRRNGEVVIRSPIAVLIRVPMTRKGLHWITIVDIEESDLGKTLIVNQWSDQYRIPFELVAKWSRGVKNSFGLFLSAYMFVGPDWRP